MIKSKIYSIHFYQNGYCSTLHNNAYMFKFKTCAVKKSTNSDSIYIDGMTTENEPYRHRFTQTKTEPAHSTKSPYDFKLISVLYIGDTVIDPGSPLIDFGTLCHMINDEHVKDVLDRV